MAARGCYSVVAENQAISTAITILELTAPATCVLLLMRAWCSIAGGTAGSTAAALWMELLRKTATITGTASPPSIRALGSDQAASSSVKWKATAEGTDGNILDAQGFNVLSNGYLWVPTLSKSQIIVPPSGIVALKFAGAPPANVNFNFGFEFEELG